MTFADNDDDVVADDDDGVTIFIINSMYRYPLCIQK